MKLDILLLSGAVLIFVGIVDAIRENLGLDLPYEKLVAAILVGVLTWGTTVIMGKWFEKWSEIKVRWYIALPTIVGSIIIIPNLIIYLFEIK